MVFLFCFLLLFTVIVKVLTGREEKQEEINMSAQILSVKYNENNVPYIGLGDHEIRLESEPPSDAVMEKARNELRELPEIVEPAIAELREMLKGKQWKIKSDS